MMRAFPSVLADAVAKELAREGIVQLEFIDFMPASGGCINNGGRLTTNSGEYFIKWNDNKKYPGMLRSEAEGLRLLSEATNIEIPEVIAEGECGEIQFLLLTHIGPGSRKRDYWKELGEGLALLHQTTATQFGLAYNNFIGSLPQSNLQRDSWLEFFIHERLEKQLHLARAAGVCTPEMERKFGLLFSRLPQYLVIEKPALLHGDLWSGNIMANSKGAPALIDSAVSFGNREMDLAMTTLFGGFESDFYDAYQQCLPVEKGYRDRWEIYNLYPLLVHLNLFGSSYASQIMQTLRKFTA